MMADDDVDDDNNDDDDDDDNDKMRMTLNNHCVVTACTRNYE